VYGGSDEVEPTQDRLIGALRRLVMAAPALLLAVGVATP
jgi:hypothetical protein